MMSGRHCLAHGQGRRVQKSGACRVLSRSIVAILLALGAAPAQAASGDAAAVVGHFDDALIRVMSQAKTLGYGGRYAILEPVIDEIFDVPSMTRIAVGPSWSGFTDDQKNRLTKAFGHFITATFADRFDDYGGEKFQVQGTRAMGGGVLVQNQMIKPDGEHIRINYLTHQTDNGWQAIDVYLDGTISEMAVRRSEFTAILGRSGAEGLIATLEEKTQQLAMK